MGGRPEPASVSVINTADISITKTGASTVAAGSNLSYAITVSNAGPQPAVNAA